MPRRVMDNTVICNVASVSATRVELDCGHGTDIPAEILEWMRAGLAALIVGQEEICVECVEQEIAAGRAARASRWSSPIRVTCSSALVSMATSMPMKSRPQRASA